MSRDSELYESGGSLEARGDGMLMQVDDSTKKNFLKKIAYPNVSFDELFLGGAVCMYVA